MFEIDGDDSHAGLHLGQVDAIDVDDLVGCAEVGRADGAAEVVMESYDAAASGEPHVAFRGNSDGTGVRIWSTGSGASGGYGDQCLNMIDDLDDDGYPEVLRGTAWGGRRIEVRGAEDGWLLRAINGDGENHRVRIDGDDFLHTWEAVAAGQDYWRVEVFDPPQVPLDEEPAALFAFALSNPIYVRVD